MPAIESLAFLTPARLQVGFSAGTPPHADLLADVAFDGDRRTYDLSHNRVSRLAANPRGDYLGDAAAAARSPRPGPATRARICSPAT